MSSQTIAFAFGCFLLLIGIIGGGFEAKEIKVPLVSPTSRVVSTIVGLIFVALSFFNPDLSRISLAPPVAPVTMSAMEDNTDRFGDGYADFLTGNDNPQLCEDRCKQEPQCKAWTFLRPGAQNFEPRCWLKDSVTPKRSVTCCISGVKTTR